MYFAPTYFSPYYFSPLTRDTPVATQESTHFYSDDDAFAAIANLLDETRSFEEVLVDRPLERGHCSSSLSPSAVIRHEGWEQFDDFDPILLLRTVRFSISINARIADSERRFAELSRLDSVVRRTLTGASLDGCLPSMTMMHNGEYVLDSSYPAASLRINGRFSYLPNI